MFNKNIGKAPSFFLLLTVIVLLGACSAAPQKNTSYTSSSGVVTMLDNDQESCARSCNADFDRCSESSAAQSPVGRGQMTGIFGAQADCKDSLKACFSRCKAR